MATKRSEDELLEELEKKMSQLAERKKQLQARRNEKERKARTKRLIEIGGAVESVLGRPIEKDDLPKLIAFLESQEQRGKFFSKAMEKNEDSL